MKQNDYRSYGQPMQNFRQPNPYQQPLAQNYMPPQPTMQGGNFAPRPMNPQVQMQGGMFPNQPYMQNNSTMPGFEQMYGQNGTAWQDIDLRRKPDITDEQADAAVASYDKFLDEMSGQVDMSVSNSGNVQQVISALRYVINALCEPEGWLPTSQQNQVNRIKTSGTRVANVLKVFADEISKISG